MHGAVERLAMPRQRDKRAPCGHAADERLGAVDRIEHPDVFGVGTFGGEFLAHNAVFGERPVDQSAHGRFRGTVGGRDRIEAARSALVLDAEGRAKERPDRIARGGGEFVDKRCEVYRGHISLCFCLSGELRRAKFMCCRLVTLARRSDCRALRCRYSKQSRRNTALVLQVIEPTLFYSPTGKCDRICMSFGRPALHNLQDIIAEKEGEIGQQGLRFVRRSVCCCSAVAARLASGTVALLGRFLPSLGPLATASVPFSCAICACA